MSYTALYRKFRPGNFEDVKGQDHIVTTLRNQIKADRVGHAYLFCGTRGTGKTSVAKLFAKTVNCEHPEEGNPCMTCNSCKAIQAGASMNVIEIDAASNNGVDNIREIVDEVSYSPTEGKYKVYIIDEVHMLSIGAFNALLKTLEEPPSYVIFILATTEVHKIPITIMSRCQRYDFKRISLETIADRMRNLTVIEGVGIEEKALRFIAKTADGSMRDALSLLDQCIAFHYGQELTYDQVLSILGAVDTEVFSRLLRGIAAEKPAECISIIEEVVMQGRELTQFVHDFAWYLRNLLLVKSSDQMEDLIDLSSENLQRLKEEAKEISENQIFRFIRIFQDTLNSMKYSSSKRIMLEIALIKLCKPEMEKDKESILERVRSLEDKVEKGVPAVSYLQQQSLAERSIEEKKIKEVPKAIPEEVKMAVEQWSRIVSLSSAPLRVYLKNARLSLGGDNKLLMVVEDGIAWDYFHVHPEEKKRVEEMIRETIERDVEVEVRKVEKKEEFEQSYIDLSQIINIEIEEEE